MNDPGRLLCLFGHQASTGEVLQNADYSLATTSLPMSTGWQGKAPPKDTQEQICGMWKDGSIQEFVSQMLPIPYEYLCI